MSDLVTALRHEAAEYEFSEYATTPFTKAADEIERLETELANTHDGLRE